MSERNDFDGMPEIKGLKERDKQREQDIADGKIVCDIKDPENCESCSG